MRCIVGVALAAVVATVLLASDAAAQTNRFSNPGYENPVAAGPAPFTGRWEPFNGAGATSVRDALMPRTGANNAHLTITGVNDTFAGAFQDVAPLVPGTRVTFSGWLKSASALTGYVPEMRIEWRNAGSTSEISRTPNFNPVITNTYTQFSLTNVVVPAGAATARAVFAIQTFGDSANTNTGDVFGDDFSFTVIPEPGSAGLAAVAGLALAAFRRRRA